MRPIHSIVSARGENLIVEERFQSRQVDRSHLFTLIFLQCVSSSRTCSIGSVSRRLRSSARSGSSTAADKLFLNRETRHSHDRIRIMTTLDSQGTKDLPLRWGRWRALVNSMQRARYKQVAAGRAS